jgi:5'-nucleotidase
LLPPTAIRTFRGVKIGFIGMTLEGTPSIVSRRASSASTS